MTISSIGLAWIDDLLEDLKREHVHAAIVIDEYGETGGQIVRDGPHTYRVNGLLPLTRMTDYFGIEIPPDPHAKTIGGYVFSLIGRQPEIGQQVEIGPYSVRVERLDGLRIAEVRFIGDEQAAALIALDD
ncbi:MAG: transporter associated domain-containing protein [Chloroflexota bacterium]